MTLSFLALPVIPELRLTDRGLVPVSSSKLLPLVVGGHFGDITRTRSSPSPSL